MVFKSLFKLSASGGTLSVSHFRSLFMAGATFLLLVASGSANAILFSYTCFSVDCDGDTDFSLQIELADSVVSPNGGYSTGFDGGAGFLGWSASSSVGDGFSISGQYSDILNVTAYLGFTFDDRGVIDGLFRTDSTSNDPLFLTPEFTHIHFEIEGEGMIAWHRDTWGAPGIIDERYDLSVPVEGSGTDSQISGEWSIVVTPVPEPSIAILIASGLVAFGVVRRKSRI